MDLLEYQAKKLFNQVGIPVLPSQTISDARDLKRLQIPYPVVIKSQVRVGGRGKAGGIRFVENTIDAIAAARTILNLPILGQYPEILLAEARYNAEKEFFMAIVLDYQLQRPVLLGSATGGVNVEELLKNMQKVVIDEDFSPFYAKKLTIKMKLPGSLIESVSAVIEKMYYLFVEKDLDLIEINPLGVNANGELMALDGKISVNDYALQRHPDIISLTAPINKKKSVVSQVESKQNEAIIDPVLPTLIKIESGEKTGNIGIISNSFGLSLSTWDLIFLEKGKPDYCLIIGQETSQELLSNSLIVQQLEKALDQLLEQKLKVILINIVEHEEICQNIAQAIANYIQPQIEPITNSKAEERTVRPTGSLITSRERSPQFRGQKKLDINQTKFVIRLIGGKIEQIKQDLTSLPIYWLENLEQAINQTVNLSKIES